MYNTAIFSSTRVEQLLSVRGPILDKVPQEPFKQKL